MEQKAPRCPDPRRLRSLVENYTPAMLEIANGDDIVQALEWLATYLENRNLYHKRQQLKNKIFKQLCIERGLGEQAEKLAKDATFDFISKQQPDDEVFVDMDEETHAVERKVG